MSHLGVDQIADVDVSIAWQRLNRARDLPGELGIESLAADIPSIDRETNIALRQGARLAGPPFVDQKPESIPPLRILRLQPRAQDAEAAIDALRALAAMGLLLAHLVHVAATDRGRDQLGAAVIADDLHDLRLGHREERVLDGDGLPKEHLEQQAEAGKSFRMRGSARSRPDQLSRNGQVKADDAVLAHQDTALAEHAADGCRERCEHQ